MGTRQEREELFDRIVVKAREIMFAKAHDYNVEEDVNANFKSYRMVGVSPVDGLLTRLVDKLCRLASISKKGSKVKDESVDDTIIDLINYAVILSHLLRDKDVR